MWTNTIALQGNVYTIGVLSQKKKVPILQLPSFLHLKELQTHPRGKFFRFFTNSAGHLASL